MSEGKEKNKKEKGKKKPWVSTNSKKQEDEQNNIPHKNLTRENSIKKST